MKLQLTIAREQLAAQRWSAASDIAVHILSRVPDDSEALLIAGEAASRSGQFREALRFYERINPSDRQHFVQGLMAAAEIHRVVGSLDHAEFLYRQVIADDPKHVAAKSRLVLLLKLTGRKRELRPLILELIAVGQSSIEQLLWLANPERPVAADEFLKQSLVGNSQQVFPQLGMATQQLSRHEFSAAGTLLARIRDQLPQHPEIEVAYGLCLWEQQALSDLRAWHSALAESSREHPQVWYLRGLLCENDGQTQAACRCFLECLSRDPQHQAGAHRAGHLLAMFGEPTLAARLKERSRRLGELAVNADQVQAAAPDLFHCRLIVSRLEVLGRRTEAFGWLVAISGQFPSELKWVETTVRRLGFPQRVDAATSDSEFFPDFDRIKNALPLPVNDPLPPAAQAPATNLQLVAEVEFVDEAPNRSLEFTYYEDPVVSTEGRRMPEFTGGGVAVLDYDLNGWPDLHFTQGAELPASAGSMTHLDQLFRNTGRGAFDNVTTTARVIEDSFSQGVAAGDINNDGFPDLYVANIGNNRLFLNLGDGTFADVSHALPDSDQWTTSCAIADVNSDGVPDLYDVNYLSGPDVLERRCPTPVGDRVCTPHAFAGAADRLLLGNADGTFLDFSKSAGIADTPGKGLGILIAPLSGRTAVDLFVANDTEANFLFVNERTPGQPPHFSEQAIPIGLAFGSEGQAQASMGIAASDFDKDGRIDLFVTNYFNESNNLYVSNSSGLFDDKSHPAGLRAPSLPMLGFGTQALDVELDGDSDLVVTNGDLDDFRHETRPFRMRPQLFLNNGDARFVEVAGAGDYFSEASLHRGRGLARLDWNRDGREDFVVAQLDEPAALVTNRTASIGESLVLQFVGTNSSRDAVGLRVQVFPASAPQRVQHHWITAGDGYHSSNQRQLVIGTARIDGPWTVIVNWPDGTRREHTGLEPKGTWIVHQSPGSIPVRCTAPGVDE
ncbi:MAG: FG-GAP-like repeat-containing protein [Planctomycetaceae bacterium]|nr:FG-GAP-like repeat-containing protein [Planctomycetaceae bacterium]